MKLRFTLPALAELEVILDPIVSRSPQGAGRVQARLQTYLQLLPAYPLIGARTDDPTLRRLVLRPHPYVLLYEVGEGEIIVHSIRHAARQP